MTIRENVIESLKNYNVENGLLNCHLPHVHSLVIKTRTDGSLLRVFYVEQGHTLNKLFDYNGNFTVGPHNHDKPLTFHKLFGTVFNVDMQLGSNFKLYTWKFTSALETGKFGLQYMTADRFDISLRPIDHLRMNTSDLHTVLVSSPTAAWIVDEGRKEKCTKWILSTTPSFTLENTPEDNLYVPMTGEHIKKYCNLILKETVVNS